MTCGNGVQHQLLQCTRLFDNGTVEIVDKSRCEDTSISPSQRQCEMVPCGLLEWGAGEWSMVRYLK